MAWRVAADIGGTFTDIARIDGDGRLTTVKVPSTPRNYGRGVVSGVSILAERDALDLAALSDMAHGCTVATNAILEGRGARTALLTTAGFRDVLELRRIRVPRLYEPLYVKPEPLAPRNLRFEARERIGADGAVVVALNEADVGRAADAIRAADAEAVAVCFLHSYANPDHERRAGEILAECLPGVFISLSVDVLPQIREYERTSTTVANAYVGPPVRRYLDGMEAELKAIGCPARISVMQSSGGVIDAAAAKEKPAQIVECGPAAGVVGAAHLVGLMGIANAITFDMGGTTAKASMIEKGAVMFAEDYEIGASMNTGGAVAGGGGYALKLPVIDISEVGAGGGSIVRLDRAGAIKVGPDSAGADPGPACYGTGGEEPTVTDANVVLGYLNQSTLAGGAVPIDAALSRRALERAVAGPLGLYLRAAAHGVHAVANATMVRAIKAVTTYRGRDPRDFAMVAFGGNGGVHGAGIARALEIGRVIVPPAAGVFSAVGLLVAERAVSVAAACAGLLDALPAATADAVYAELQAGAERLLGLAAGASRCARQVEMRYVGQAFELPVDLGADGFAQVDRDALRARFDAEHMRRFGHAFEGEPVEIVALRLKAADPEQGLPPAISAAAARGGGSTREGWFGDAHGAVETQVIGRGDLDETPRRGPLIVEEYEGTTVVPPDAAAHRDRLGNIVVELEYRR